MPRDKLGDGLRIPDDPRKFYRVATQRFAEALFLFEGGRFAASIYIAGYAVECGLRALILTTVPRNRQVEFASTFRGSGWHNFDRLVELYISNAGSRPPLPITKHLTYVHDEWSVEMRYVAGEKPFREAKRFIDSTESILEWVKGRL